jgi:hypothetical protein
MDEWDHVRADLGDKVVAGLITAITRTKDDLARYRQQLPDIAYEQSTRGLANWINDRMWMHVVRELFDVPDVVAHEQGVTREIYVGTRYRLRLKRHDGAGLVSNYRTPTALAFWEADDFALPGMEEMRLCFGYVWDAEVEQIGDPVISRRDGQENVLWMERLDESAAGGGNGSVPVVPITPPTTPKPPVIGLPTTEKKKDGTETE